MPLTREIKILRYIYRHEEVTGKQLTNKFPDIYKYYSRLDNKYIDVYKAEDVLTKSYLERKHISNNESIISLTIYGDDVVLKHKQEFWNFMLPCGITTIIALVSVAPTVIKIVRFIVAFFSQGAP